MKVEKSIISGVDVFLVLGGEGSTGKGDVTDLKAPIGAEQRFNLLPNRTAPTQTQTRHKLARGSAAVRPGSAESQPEPLLKVLISRGFSAAVDHMKGAGSGPFAPVRAGRPGGQKVNTKGPKKAPKLLVVLDLRLNSSKMTQFTGSNMASLSWKTAVSKPRPVGRYRSGPWVIWYRAAQKE